MNHMTKALHKTALNATKFPQNLFDHCMSIPPGTTKERKFNENVRVTQVTFHSAQMLHSAERNFSRHAGLAWFLIKSAIFMTLYIAGNLF